MKTLFSFILLTCSVVAFAQSEYTPDMVASTTKNVKNITKYTATDGSVWEVGGEVTFGNATGNGTFVWVQMGDGIMAPIVLNHPLLYKKMETYIATLAGMTSLG